MPRLRKAYAVIVRGYDGCETVFAPTSAQAKAATLRVMHDVGAHDARKSHMRACRAPDSDVLLPDEHRLVADLTPKERHIIAHAYGSDVPMGKEGYRNHFCTDPSSSDGRRLLRLSWEFGLFSGPHGEKAYGNTGMWCGAFFFLTELGREVARSLLSTYGRH